MKLFRKQGSSCTATCSLLITSPNDNNNNRCMLSSQYKLVNRTHSPSQINGRRRQVPRDPIHKIKCYIQERFPPHRALVSRASPYPPRQFITSADRASTPRVFAYILGIVGRVDGANRPQVLKLRISRRLKREFDCRWAYEEGRGPVFSAHSGVTYQLQARRHISREHDNLSSLTRPGTVSLSITFSTSSLTTSVMGWFYC